ncbi:lysine-specific demethylase JMJ30-like isoform X2 [Mangifera indica]|uniref:lysine-specific demethylase JMJ30-like isoform X2 n=1 Tax=Mangifera indica TaxID=29780 RepID=UPI001CF98FB9|nr:lysine-specific demethylase JMJ30-like isoform X2 [Mangifera indica]
METYFPTPILDEESSGLLKMISEHGGYAYVSMLAQAAAGDTRAAEAAREMAWEQLHSGPWHSVLPVWRDAFSMACLHVARHHCRDGEFKEALRVLDMGVIMGGPLLRKDLDSAIETVSFRARIREGEKNGEPAGASSENGRRLVSEEEFDKAEVRSLSCKIVVKRSGLSLEGFLREYFLSGSPVIITDCMAHWPARTKWNDIDYLKRVAGDRTVPVEVGKNYLCPEWKQELIPFSQFLERIRLTGNSSDVLTYLAQHPLFDQINELRKDICIPDYCFAGGGELRSLNAWFGPVGTVTPLHHDPHHNILAQVVGKKYIRLYPASLLEELYPYTETMLCNSSQVDLDHIDDSQFPKVSDLDFFDCILNEGEMIYIPPKWWHYVRSLSISLSVSFWWGSDAGGSTSS